MELHSPPAAGPVPRPPRQPIFNAPPVTMALVLVIALAFVALRLLPEDLAWTLQVNLSLVPAWVAAVVADLAWPQMPMALASLLTHALIHVDALHFALNAGLLLAFGSACERALGRRRYVVLLLVSALGGAVAQIASDWATFALRHGSGAVWDDFVLMQGASGVVMGCMGGVARLMLGGTAQQARFAIIFVVLLFALNLLFGLIGGRIVGVDAAIAWQAHIGGFVAGFWVARRRRLDLVV